MAASNPSPMENPEPSTSPFSNTDSLEFYLENNTSRLPRIRVRPDDDELSDYEVDISEFFKSSKTSSRGSTNDSDDQSDDEMRRTFDHMAEDVAHPKPSTSPFSDTNSSLDLNLEHISYPLPRIRVRPDEDALSDYEVDISEFFKSSNTSSRGSTNDSDDQSDDEMRRTFDHMPEDVAHSKPSTSPFSDTNSSLDLNLEHISYPLPRIRVRPDQDELSDYEVDISEFFKSLNTTDSRSTRDHQSHHETTTTFNNHVTKDGRIVTQATTNLQSEHENNRYHDGTLRNYYYEVIRTQLALQALNPEGSMSLQEKLMANDGEITDIIFEAIFEHVFLIMDDQYGTHVFGKLIQHCQQSQLQVIVTKITRNPRIFLELIFNKHGAKSAIRLIKVLKNSPVVYGITSVLASAFVMVMTDKTASSVILKCFDVLNAIQNQKLYEETLKNCFVLATDVTGCIVLNNSISYIRNPHKTQLLVKISAHAVYLSEDHLGNYVLQRVLQLQHPGITNMVCLALKGNYVNLSMKKCSSHVVEKCLMSLGMDYVLEEFANFDKLWQIASDQYGNYVIKTALLVAQSQESPFYPMLLKKLDQDKEKFKIGFGINVYNMVLNSGI